MTESDHDWIEYWTVFTDAAGIHDAKLWIEHGRYDGMADPHHRKNMNGWELPPD